MLGLLITYTDHLDVEHVKEMDRESLEARKAGFDDLVIDQRYRDLLVALVDSHASGLQREEEKTKQGSRGNKRTQIDLVRGKGQGLIILLHGPPGSGKTSTAETIAAYTGRPLYAITCGDIGITPEEVENRLFMHTRRADRWGCVLLLDEADVFLVQRDWHNIQRNALVSGLSILHSYTGLILIPSSVSSGVGVLCRYSLPHHQSTWCPRRSLQIAHPHLTAVPQHRSRSHKGHVA